VISIALSTAIGAGRETVWRALTDPSELIRWDERILESQGAIEGYPSVGSCARWRYRLGNVPVMLSERPLLVCAPERLDVEIELGLFRFSVSYGVGREDADRTKLLVKLATGNSVPLVGGALDRFDVRRAASDFLDLRLRALQKWCENHPGCAA
jgi:hypothetical protein